MEAEFLSDYIVIGAGIVGVSTAIWLQRAGHSVTIIDRTGPAAGATYGNAGVITSSSVVPVPVPGLLGKAPKMLFDTNQPLFLKWSYLPKLLPFLRSYLGNAKHENVERISAGLAQLLHDAPDQHIALAKGTKADAFIGQEDYLFGYSDKAAFDADQFGWSLRATQGVEFEELTSDQLAQFDPALAGRFGYGIRCPNHGRIRDPGAYVTALADHFVEQGGTIKIADVTGFDLHNGHCRFLTTDEGKLAARKYIVTTGAWAQQWERLLGVKVRLESERGYHLEYVNPSITLKSPLMVAGGKFVVHSMNGRLRCAGVIEFGGLKNAASTGPVKLLKKQMADLFPDLRYDRIDEWMGHRPATTDSLPIIGQSPAAQNIYLGYGHQHVGLSGGPKTGRWLAKLASGEPINADLSAFSADRI